MKRRYTHFNFSGDTSTFFKLKAHLHSMINQCSVVDFLPASWSRCTYNSDTLRWAKRQLRISSPYNDGWQKRAEPAKNETLVIEKKQLSLGKQAKHQIRLYFSSVVSRSTNAAGGATAETPVSSPPGGQTIALQPPPQPSSSQRSIFAHRSISLILLRAKAQCQPVASLYDAKWWHLRQKLNSQTLTLTKH